MAEFSLYEYWEIFKDGSPIVAILLSIGALVNGYYKNRAEENIELRKNRRDDFVTILDAREKEIEAREKDIEANKLEILSLREQMQMMQARLSALEARFSQHPFIEWAIGFEGRYIWASPQMHNTFLYNRPQDWIYGKTHADVWPPNVIEVLLKLDAKVRGAVSRSAITAHVPIDGVGKFTFIKWGQPDPVTGAILHYHGMAIPED